MLGDLIAAYKLTQRYLRLSPRTKSDYDKALKEINKVSDMVLVHITHHDMINLRDSIGARRGWRSTNHILQLLSIMFNTGIDKGMMPANPVARVKKLEKPHDQRSLNRRWTDDERKTVLSMAPRQLLAPLATLRYMGLRLGDMIRLRWADIGSGKLTLVTAKRKVPVVLPVPPGLAQILDELPRIRDYVFVNLDGRQWTVKGFDSSWRAYKKDLEITKVVGLGLTPHGLRHSLAHDMRELGATNEQIAYALGQSSPGVVARYTRTVDMTASNQAIFDRLYPQTV